MTWEFNDFAPIYIQLIDQIQLRIISRVYPIGEKLPSVRDMAKEASVNPNTMQKALTELERRGLVYSQRTAGRFITEDLDMIKDMKKDLAKEQVENFLLGMKKIGFDKKESISIMEKLAKEME
ncbi:GntR family transcriptional regulator [Clostridium vincentii]|uniref:HTH-type transcriptional repressor YtrA n=1 Tax=Clostridium vincentii TaxID=52704 RepID=A0A2T0BFH5_9CLOT|nr:GntR family transcriptional regulator [Clostridium vincentii]PRR82624.1 HTH-type transcriptional repressor YtrA [Clostridium vincentii]